MATENEISLQVTGMSCAGCAGRAERALQAVDGVRSASVNLANATVRVDYSGPVTDLTAALEGAGYPAAVERVLLDIKGMNCASCVGRVERALAEVPGVVQAHVNLASETARVEFATASLAVGDLIRAIEAAG